MNNMKRGFTIVELLIVIVVIAILAAIIIVSYNGITRSATEASLKSDINNASKIVENDKTLDGAYPVSASMANEGAGLQSSQGNTLMYLTKSYGYCIAASNPSIADTFVLHSNSGSIETGTCDTTVSTIAGSGVAGFNDDVGIAAQFNYPLGVAIDTSGNLYIAEWYGHRIRKITPDGTVSTLAGTGVAGFQDGAGASAQFNRPCGIAIDESGNLYVTEWTGNRIRMVTPTGTVSTIAGSGTAGYVDATGASAQFRNPSSIAIGLSGELYVADGTNDRIRMISAGGVVTTFAGSSRGYQDGIGTAAQFNQPYGIAIDATGDLYVADNNNNRIRKIAPDRTVTTVAGDGTQGYADGPALAAKLYFPSGIAIDSSGYIYIAATGDTTLRVLAPDGNVSTVTNTLGWGYADGASNVAQFKLDWPGNIMTTDNVGNLYIADGTNHRIRKVAL